MNRNFTGDLVFRLRTDRARNHSGCQPAGVCTRLTCTDRVEVMGRYSNLSEQGERLQDLLQMVPKGSPEVNVRFPKQVQRRLRPAEIKELTTGYLDGRTIHELADQFRIHRVTVSKLLARAGIPRRYHILGAAAIEQAVALYQSGQSLATIGHQLQVDPGTVRAALLKAGVRMRDCQGRERP